MVINRMSLRRTLKNNQGKKKPSSTYVTGDFHLDLKRIKQEIGDNSDVNFREFNLGNTEVKGAIIFVSGFTDKDLIEKHIMKSLMTDFVTNHLNQTDSLSTDYIKNHVLSISKVSEINKINELKSKVLVGSTALLIEGLSEILILGTMNGKTRDIQEPVSEESVRGPRTGFNENLDDNTALLRRYCKNENLSFKKFQVGESTKKELIVAYIEGIADSELVQEVNKRIKEIDIDNVMESGYIEQFIEDNFLSPFPQVQNTERPDRVISSLMEGRVSILLDGTPFVLIVPVTFSMMLQTPEDYYERWLPGTLIRFLRFFAAVISLFGPSIYIAFVSFHQGLIPTKLIISIIGTREGVPFPSIIEALIMEVSIEILREAGLRLPKPVGQTIGIVGALIVGEAAVQAGIVSPLMVIVVAVTAISSFSIPQYSLGITLRFLRFASMLFAAVLGLYGIILFFLLLCSHLVKLKSFGVPYLSPAVPYRLRDWKDLMIRMPLQMMKYRPKIMRTNDSVRIRKKQKKVK